MKPTAPARVGYLHTTLLLAIVASATATATATRRTAASVVGAFQSPPSTPTPPSSTSLPLLFTRSSCLPSNPSSPFPEPERQSSTTALHYEPKWKKKLTMAEKAALEKGGAAFDPADVGLKGTIQVVFQQGPFNKTTVAMPGQPLRDVASQAGQFIKYGCGKGECGTCEAMSDGKWIRPCMATVPADLGEGASYVVRVKEVKSKSTSSGKFFSVKSFFKGFWNNLLGMVGFVRDRRKAKRNWNERKEFEDEIAKRVAEKKAKREAEARAKAEAKLK